MAEDDFKSVGPPLELTTSFTVPNKWAQRIVFGGFGVFTGLIALGIALERWSGPGVAPAVMFFAAFAALMSSFGGALLRERARQGVVKIDARGVDLAGTMIPRERIKTAYVVPPTKDGPTRVILEGLTKVAVRDVEEGERALDALGLGTRQKSTRFSAVAPTKSLAGVLALTLMGVGLGLGTALMIAFNAPLLLAFGTLLAMLGPIVFVPADIHIGADGLLLAPRVGKKFVPWEDVQSIEPTKRGVRLSTTRGALDLPLTSRFRLYYEYEREQQAGIVERVREALEAYRRGDPVDASARLAKHGQSVERWLTSLSELLRNDFRSASVTDDVLWRVAESTTAEPTARAAAAAVLAKELAPADRTRLRVAAEACASPKLRVVLEKAADGAEEALLREALVELAHEDETERNEARATR